MLCYRASVMLRRKDPFIRNCEEMSVLGRQRAAMERRRHDQLHSHQNCENSKTVFDSHPTPQVHSSFPIIGADQYFDGIFADLGHCRLAACDQFLGDTASGVVHLESVCTFDTDCTLPLSSNYPTAFMATETVRTPPEEERGGGSGLSENAALMSGRRNSKKRKAELVAGDNEDDRIVGRKVEAEESEAAAKSDMQTSAGNSKENSKVSEVQKPDYIHVRARRGKATDSHSLAERARREKIGKKMKCLQDLVPGCDKVTGKAGMLDEIINYVQSLQRQVEFLSMKLACLSPNLNFNFDSFPTKEFPAYMASFPAATLSPPQLTNVANLQLIQAHGGATCGIDFPVNPTQMASQAEGLSTWRTDIQGLCNAKFH